MDATQNLLRVSNDGPLHVRAYFGRIFLSTWMPDVGWQANWVEDIGGTSLSSCVVPLGELAKAAERVAAKTFPTNRVPLVVDASHVQVGAEQIEGVAVPTQPEPFELSWSSESEGWQSDPGRVVGTWSPDTGGWDPTLSFRTAQHVVSVSLEVSEFLRWRSVRELVVVDVDGALYGYSSAEDCSWLHPSVRPSVTVPLVGV